MSAAPRRSRRRTGSGSGLRRLSWQTKVYQERERESDASPQVRLRPRLTRKLPPADPT
ncbi:hypothetical protein Taro_016489 [Colocasia esculenta]|uniref:Uncharacterized protein n=1 Tax=Colocasia esculenta TaxID=4460 RepID=A0A843UKG6_COLES|nr:hypothetical protein [Colocasia esculenta]